MRDDRVQQHRREPCALAAACCVLLLISACGIVRGDENSAKDGEKKHPLDPALKMAKSSRDSIYEATNYIAIFRKKELIGKRYVIHTMQIKQRREPFSVYLRFIGEHDGREVIYVDGRNGGKLLVHETGLAGIVGTISLLPTSPDAMGESIHPITDIGMWNLVDKVIAQWELERKFENTEIKYYPNAKLGSTECRVIEATHPYRQREFHSFRTRLYIDKKTNFPIRVEHYGYPAEDGAQPPLIGEYQYTDIRTDQKFADIDFDVKNPKYGY